MKYRKKAVVIDAVPWVGDFQPIQEMIPAGTPDPFRMTEDGVLQILTLEGTMTAAIGDWIIRGVSNEFYPVKDHIFNATYEAA